MGFVKKKKKKKIPSNASLSQRLRTEKERERERGASCCEPCVVYAHEPNTNACNFPPFFVAFSMYLRCDSPYVWIGCIGTDVWICMYNLYSVHSIQTVCGASEGKRRSNYLLLLLASTACLTLTSGRLSR